MTNANSTNDCPLSFEILLISTPLPRVVVVKKLLSEPPPELAEALN